MLRLTGGSDMPYSFTSSGSQTQLQTTYKWASISEPVIGRVSFKGESLGMNTPRARPPHTIPRTLRFISFQDPLNK